MGCTLEVALLLVKTRELDENVLDLITTGKVDRISLSNVQQRFGRKMK